MQEADDKRFKVARFMDAIKKRLAESRENLEWLVDAYNWWQWPDNEREMRKAYPKAHRRWLRQEIMRIFNVDPQMLSRIVTRLAGSKKTEPRTKAWRFAKRIGTYELYYADRVLKPEQLKTLASKFPGGNVLLAPEDVRTVVDDMAEIIKSKPMVGSGDRIDYRREYLKLLQQNAALKKEVQMLRETLKGLEVRPRKK